MLLLFSAPAAHAATVSISANPVSVTTGATSILTWSSTDATSCAASGDWSGVKAASGSQRVFPLNASSTYTVTCTGTGAVATQSATVSAGAACSSTGATGAIALSNVSSRLTGVAPLSVFFDATGTTATSTTRPFHELEYTWSFGDTGAGNWAQGAANKSKNAAKGPIAAHVFETSGIYTVTLTVTDGTNTVTNNCARIVVTDPDAIFAGKTRYIYSSVPLGGLPSGTEVATKGNVATDASDAIAAGATRILFKRGDSFVGSKIDLKVAGPGHLGVYGAGAKPIINSSDITVVRILGVDDWRVVDLSLTGSLGDTADVTGVSLIPSFQGPPPHHTTILRTKIDSMNGSIVTQGNPTNIVIAECDIQNARGINLATTGVYISGATNVAVLGSYLNVNRTKSHNTRLQGVNKSVFSDNTTIGGSVQTPLTIRGDSQHGVVSNNHVSGIFALSIIPQNNTSNEWERDILVERNFFSNPGLWLESTDITIRNNVFTGGAKVTIRKEDTTGLVPMPTRINIYNNTVYNLTTATSESILLFTPAGINSTSLYNVINNIAYAPLSTSPLLSGGLGAPTITPSKNTNNVDIKTRNPVFTNGSGQFNTPSDFALQAVSYGVNAGDVTLGNYTAFDGTARPTGAAVDMGAFER